MKKSDDTIKKSMAASILAIVVGVALTSCNAKTQRGPDMIGDGTGWGKGSMYGV